MTKEALRASTDALRTWRKIAATKQAVRAAVASRRSRRAR